MKKLARILAEEGLVKKEAQHPDAPAYTRKIISQALLKLGREGIIEALGSFPDYANPGQLGLNPWLLTPADALRLAEAIETSPKTRNQQAAARLLRRWMT
jgi:hypothetical protein